MSTLSSKTPTDDDLRAYLAGDIDEPAADRIERYLENNEAAPRRLNALSIHDDPFVKRLREMSRGSIATSDQPVTHEAPWGEQQIGRRLGPYHLKEILGRGAMGVVFRAFDDMIHRDVAVKVLSSSLSQNAELARRFVAEARAAGRLKHPHVVAIYTADTSGQTPYFAMELADGGTAHDRVKAEGALPWRDAVRLVAEACEGLGAAHDAGLVHRDIKPSNLMLTGDGRVKVGDFGLVKVTNEATVTVTGQFMGTPHYTSPEQFEGGTVCPLTDIYALGATFYALLTGEKPYADRSTPSQIMYAHLQEPVPDPRHQAPDVPALVAQVIARAMAKIPSKRYGDCAEMREDLGQLLESGGDTTTSDPGASSLWGGFGKLPTGPSIAVLPFDNISEEPEAEAFSDGLTEEIITQLAKFRDLFVVARNTTFRFKGEAVDVKKVGAELGVGYVLEGSVRRSADRMRITAQLLDARSGGHLWAQTFRGNLTTADVFDIQDQIAEQVAATLALPYGVIAQSRLKSRANAPGTIDAYDCVTHFYEYWRTSDPKMYEDVRRDLEATVVAEPRYAAAWSSLAFMYLDGGLWGLAPDESADELLNQAYDAAKQAVKWAPHDAMALHAMFRTQFHRGESEAFLDTAERALDANPNQADMLADLATCLACLGRWDRAMPLAHKAIALNPDPPGWYRVTDCWHAFVTGDFEAALAEAKRMGQMAVYWDRALRVCALGNLGRIAEAQTEANRLIEIRPDFAEQVASELSIWHVNDALRDAMISGFERAGLA